jgi:hypothetical protein
MFIVRFSMQVVVRPNSLLSVKLDHSLQPQAGEEGPLAINSIGDLTELRK